MERDEQWHRTEEGLLKEREQLQARVKELETTVRQLRRSAAASRKKAERQNNRGATEYAFASPVAPQSPMMLATYPAIPMSSSSPRQTREAAHLHHSPSSAFAAVGRAQQAAAATQLPPARPLGPYWQPPPLPSTQLFPQAPYPLAGLWTPPHIVPYGGGQQQQQSALHSTTAMAGQGFPSPMSTLSLAAHPVQPIVQPSTAPLLAAYTAVTSAPAAEPTAPAMPAITLSPPVAARDQYMISRQHAAWSTNGQSMNGTERKQEEAVEGKTVV